MKLRPFQTTILEEKDGILRPPTLPSNLACFGLSVVSSLTSSLQTGSQVERGENKKKIRRAKRHERGLRKKGGEPVVLV